MIDTLCISGGGINAFSFIGALEYLLSIKYINLKLIKTYIGTSAGAMICFLLSINYTINDLKKFILNFNFNIINDNIDLDNIFLNCGINDGSKIIYIFRKFLQNKYNNLNDITFIEHYNLTNNKLIIIGTNYTTSSEEIFSFEKTPDMSILIAIRISSSIPFIFTPVLYNNNYYVDGALLNNFPINYCNIKNTLGIKLKHNKINNCDNILSFFINCIKIITNTHNNNYININSLNIIEIDILNKNIGLNFNINYNEKEDLISNGFKEAEYYITNIGYNICNSIINDIINDIVYTLEDLK
jgi:hypothetical protein